MLITWRPKASPALTLVAQWSERWCTSLGALGLIPGMSCSESASTRGETEMMLLPPIKFSGTKCLLCIKWEIQMDGPPDNISICICKTPETVLNQIMHLNRRMCPPVNNISQYTHHSHKTSLCRTGAGNTDLSPPCTVTPATTCHSPPIRVNTWSLCCSPAHHPSKYILS